MAIPVITALPVAPTRADAQPDYSAKADTFTAALPQFSVQVNTAVSWVADTMAATLEYKGAAAASANLASLAAQTAATQAALAASGGAAQVSLATTQAQNAAQSATNAEAFAAAAQAAVGTPSLVGHDAFDVLQINVSKNGVQWGKSGQSVGDILISARVPDSTYAATNRATYLKSAYPDLAALLGTAADADRTTITNASMNSSFPADIIATYGVAMYGGLIIALCSNVAFCYTSTDNGLTWTRRATPFSAAKMLAVLNGVFVVTLSLANINYVYSTTDGITWTQRTFAVGSIDYGFIGVVAGLFVVLVPGQARFQTSPDGINWTQRSTFTSGTVQALININGNLLAFTGSSNYQLSTDGITWTQYTTQSTAGTGLNLQQIVFYNGLYYAADISSGVLYTKSTLVPGTGWLAVKPVFVDPATGNPETMSTSGACGVSPAGDSIIFNSSSARSIISNDGGVTWTSRITPAILGIPLALASKFIFFYSNNNITYTLPLRTYDPAISFITPRVTQPILPLVTYIKGKLA